MTTQLSEYLRPDGERAAGYLALPQRGAARGAVVVIQEWWGVNKQIKRTADRLAEAGFAALVPDLFHGRLPAHADEADHLMRDLDFVQATDQLLRGAVLELQRQTGGKVGCIGFCMGGALAIAAAVRIPELTSAVCFYGLPPEDVAPYERIRKPIQFHFAQHDDWCTPALVDQLERTLRRAENRSYELYRYDAQHAFANEDRPEVHDASASDQARARAMAFLTQTLRD